MHAYAPTVVTRFQYNAAKRIGNKAVNPVKHHTPRLNTLELANSNDSHTEAHPCTHAFQCLLQALWQRLGKRAATQLQLDLGAQLRQRSVSTETRLTMEYWLQSPDKSLSPLPLASLRDQLNRPYVLLCEQLGPVEADQQLKAAYQATLARLDDKEALQTLM